MKARDKLDIFVLEDWVLQGSTIFLSLLISLGGCLLLPGSKIGLGGLEIGGADDKQYVIAYLFIGSGFIGVTLSVIARELCKKRIKVLGELAEDQKLIAELGAIIARRAPEAQRQ
jgi:hypothetical protein